LLVLERAKNVKKEFHEMNSGDLSTIFEEPKSTFLQDDQDISENTFDIDVP